MSDVYKTIGDSASVEIKEKGSRFIAEAYPVESEEDVEAHLETVRKREHSATHHCSAYRLGIEGEVFRYNDDGEPSGTAGMPILRQIDGRGLTNTLVVVTRYFGGTKLGTGGLIRAYGEAASRVLDEVPIASRIIRVPVVVRFAYPDTSPAMHTIGRFDAEIEETRYTEETEMVLAVRRSQVDDFRAAFTDALAGRGAVELLRAGSLASETGGWAIDACVPAPPALLGHGHRDRWSVSNERRASVPGS